MKHHAPAAESLFGSGDVVPSDEGTRASGR
mgnify:CR=1 FL=1